VEANMASLYVRLYGFGFELYAFGFGSNGIVPLRLLVMVVI